MKWSTSNPINFSDYSWQDYSDKVAAAAQRIVDQVPNLARVKSDESFLRQLLNCMDEMGGWVQIYSALSEVNVSGKDLNLVTSLANKNAKVSIKTSRSVYLNKQIWHRFEQIEVDKLTDAQDLRLYKDLKNCFMEMGVNLNQESRKRLTAIDHKVAVLENKILENLRRELESTPLIIKDKKRLIGLSIDLCKQAFVKSKNHWKFILDDGVYSELVDNAQDHRVRKQAMVIARSLGNNDNKYNNHQLIKQIVKMRDEKAKILGYHNFVSYTLEDNMLKSEAELREFLANIKKKVSPQLAKETKMYQKNIPKTEWKAWNKFYYKNKMLKDNFSLSPEELKNYFPIQKVWTGLQEFIKKAFSVEFREENLPKYAQNVQSYSCWDLETNTQLGVLYVDLYSRSGKAPGAWMQDLVTPGDNQIPWIILAMNINLMDKVYLSLYEVKTLFHEMGHCLHGLLSKSKYSCFSGTFVAHDFVELPSQFMENLVFQPEVLKLISSHQVTGKTLPLEMVKTLRAYDNFQVTGEILQDVGHCLVDLDLHTKLNSSFKTLEKNCYQNVFPDSPKVSKITHFTHILCGQYASGYYSYLWSEILDSECLEKVQNKDGSLNYRELKRYKQEILQVGSSRDEMDSFVAFIGRKPEVSAYLRKRQVI